MKIGVMTWYKYHNYGTVLQLFAVNKKCRDFGYEPYVINYNHRPVPTKTAFIKKVKGKINSYKYKSVNSNLERIQLFNKFLNENHTFTHECNTLGELEDLNTILDAFVCGSDQIWSPLCFDKHYFLDFIKDENLKLAYAPSIGASSVNDPIIRKEISRLTSNFKYISIREKDKLKNVLTFHCVCLRLT